MQLKSSVDGIVFVLQSSIIYVCCLCPNLGTVTELQTANVREKRQNDENYRFVFGVVYDCIANKPV